MKIRTIKLAALAALCLAFAAAPAAAKLVKLPNGKTISIYPRPGSIRSGLNRNAAPNAHLTYVGGSVLHGDRTAAIYWDPSAFSSPSFKSLATRFLGDVAHDSGTFGNDYSVATQYYDGSGGIQYQSSFLGSYDDTTGYANDCLPAHLNPCVTDAAIRNRISADVSAHHVPGSTQNTIYFVFLPQNVVTCFDNTDPTSCSDDPLNGFCAYHEWDNSPPEGSHPYALILDDPVHCGQSANPNDASVDGALSSISHEHIEAITDPDPNNPAWADYTNPLLPIEIADECESDFGPALGGSGSTQFNESMNSHPYELQEEWSNDGNACMQYYPGLAPSFANGGAVAGQPMPFVAARQRNPDASYFWTFGDGGTAGGDAPSHVYGAPGTYTATLTVATTGGRSASISRAVGVGIPAPSAAFTRSPRYPRARQSVGFSAGPSSAPFQTITAYRWSFGDGTTASGPAPRHRFARNRDYFVTLTIATSTGATATTTQRVAIGDPAASFSVSGSHRAGQRLTFKAHASDPDGRIVRYRWDFGDGGHASGKKVHHTFRRGGRRTITLTVTDSDRTQTVVTHTLRLGRGVRRAAAAGFMATLAGFRL